MSLKQKLQKFEISYKQMALILSILAVVPFFVTIGLPIQIGQITKDFYNEIERLPAGSRVALALHTVPANYQDYKYGLRAIVLHIASKHLKIIVLSFEETSPTSALDLFRWSGVEQTYGYVYGRDYVIMPYLAGLESALAAVATNMHIFSTDVKGIPITQLPLMSEINTLNDIDLAILNYSSNDFAEAFVRQWPAKYGVRSMTAIRMFADIAQYYGKYIFGCLDMFRGAAEYEKLTGYGGNDIAVQDASSLSGLFVLAATFFGMIQFYSSRYAKKKLQTPEGAEKNG